MLVAFDCLYNITSVIFSKLWVNQRSNHVSFVSIRRGVVYKLEYIYARSDNIPDK